MIFNLIFIISVFMFKLFLQMWQFIWLGYDSYFRLLMVSFLLSKINYFYCVISEGFTKLFNAVFTSVHIIIFFYAIKCSNSRHWIYAGNMFTYFCCWWYFINIFTSIYFFNQRFKIYINNRWYLWYCLSSNILVSSKGITVPWKTLFSHNVL